jgi:hypothetical protein
MNKFLSLLAAAAFTLTVAGSATAAMPKAAEDEAAPVVLGADAPRPAKSTAKPAKASSKKHAQKAKKAKSGKHGQHGKHSKKAGGRK